METIEKASWANLRARKTKRNSEYLTDTTKRLLIDEKLLLPEPLRSTSSDQPSGAYSDHSSGNAKKSTRSSLGAGIERTIYSNSNADEHTRDLKNNCTDLKNSDKIGMADKHRLVRYLNPAFVIGIIHTVANAFILIVLMYLISHFLYFVAVDIYFKINTKREETKAVIKEASRLYQINKCDPTTRVPALEKQCHDWDNTMKRGLSGIKYTKICLETLGDMADGFVSRFSLRSSFVLLGVLSVYLILRR